MEPSVAELQTFPVAHKCLASLIISQWYKLRDKSQKVKPWAGVDYSTHNSSSLKTALSDDNQPSYLTLQRTSTQSVWCYTPIISTTQEAEAGWAQVRGRPGLWGKNWWDYKAKPGERKRETRSGEEEEEEGKVGRKNSRKNLEPYTNNTYFPNRIHHHQCLDKKSQSSPGLGAHSFNGLAWVQGQPKLHKPWLKNNNNTHSKSCIRMSQISLGTQPGSTAVV